MPVNQELEIIGVDTALDLMGSYELLVEIAGMLLDELPELMAQLRAEAGERDLDAMSKTAHRLKETSA